MDVILADFEVGEVYDNGMPSTSKIYIRYMKELKQKGIKRQGLKAGDALELGNGVVFKVLAPSKELAAKGTQQGYKHDPNNESVMGQLIYGDFKMMLTGDGEGPEEKDILAALGGADIHSQVLKAGHHGSKTSSSKEWLRTVNPEVGLISCGAGNDYGHPHKETLKKYQALKMKVYETDKNGTITLTSDGKTYEIAVEKGDVQ
jgi:competence protein ComEC